MREPCNSRVNLTADVRRIRARTAFLSRTYIVAHRAFPLRIQNEGEIRNQL